MRYGIPKVTALKIVSQAVLGTTRLLQGEHPVLIDQVCSPRAPPSKGCALCRTAVRIGGSGGGAGKRYEKDKAL